MSGDEVAELAELIEAERRRTDSLAGEREIFEPQARAIRRKGGTERAVELAFRKWLKPRLKPWVTVGGQEVVLPPTLEPTPRGEYLEGGRVEPDPDREVRSYEAYEAVLFSRTAAIETPDDEPAPGPLAPAKPVMRVPRRAEILDGRGLDR